MEKKMGTLIAEVRKEKKLTQKELAEKLYVTDRAVSKWERNLSYPDIELLKKISEILDVSISELINGERIEHMDNKKADETLEEGLAIYRKKSIIEFLKGLFFGAILFFIFLFIVFHIISEYNYGEINFFGITFNTIPNSSVKSAQKRTNKVMKALKNKDYAYLQNNISIKCCNITKLIFIMMEENT